MAEFAVERLLHGGDYNPEQWLYYPDIFQKDLELMKKAHINTVTLGIFAWSALEPEEEKWNFGWMEQIVEVLHENGISIILATPSGARPKWLADQYPEVLRVDSLRRRQLYGFRHNHCYTSPIYRQKVRELNIQLAMRFGNHPGVILWHISNEYGGECHCPLCQQEFRKWLKMRYRTIDDLNKRWCTAFWSHTYNSFEQIESPSPIGESQLHSLNLDWKRFVSERTVDFMSAEIQAIRDGGSTLPVTTNMMYDYAGLNYQDFADELDVISWDNYPLWHKGPEQLTAVDNAMQHDYMRSLKHQPFLMMESSPSNTNWQSVSKLKRPGMLRAASLQAVAHGSDSVLYFQIRQSLGASEKFHGAVIDHYGETDTRVFEEVTQTGMALESLQEVCGTETVAEVAVVYDVQNRWALEDSQGPRNCGLSYKDTVIKAYHAFRRLGINVDVIDESQPLNNYKIVAAPMTYLFHSDFCKKIRAFVAGGGRIIQTFLSGVVDENDRCYLGGVPHELLDVMGLRVTEVDALYDGESNSIEAVAGNSHGLCGQYQCDTICEIVKLWTAEPLGVYGSDFYKGSTAVSYNRFGKGEAYTISTNAEQKLYDDLFLNIARSAKLAYWADIPEGMEVTTRQNCDNRYIFVQNFNRHEVELPRLLHKQKKLYSELLEDGKTLPSFGSVVYKQKR